MATLQEQIDALRAARARGVQSLTLGNGEMVMYKSDAQMAEAIADLQHQIDAQNGRQLRTVRFTTSKGV